jgi:hypothetical protein
MSVQHGGYTHKEGLPGGSYRDPDCPNCLKEDLARAHDAMNERDALRSQLLSLQSQRDELAKFGARAMEFAKNIRLCTGAPGLAGGGPCMRCLSNADELLALGSTKTGHGAGE